MSESGKTTGEEAVAASSIEAESAGNAFISTVGKEKEEGEDLEGRRKALVERQKRRRRRRRRGRNRVSIEVGGILVTKMYILQLFIYFFGRRNE